MKPISYDTRYLVAFSPSGQESDFTILYQNKRGYLKHKNDAHLGYPPFRILNPHREAFAFHITCAAGRSVCLARYSNFAPKRYSGFHITSGRVYIMSRFRYNPRYEVWYPARHDRVEHRGRRNANQNTASVNTYSRQSRRVGHLNTRWWHSKVLCYSTFHSGTDHTRLVF